MMEYETLASWINCLARPVWMTLDWTSGQWKFLKLPSRSDSVADYVPNSNGEESIKRKIRENLTFLFFSFSCLLLLLKVNQYTLIQFFLFIVNYTCTRWILNPQPHPPLCSYKRRRCHLSYSSFTIHLVACFS